MLAVFGALDPLTRAGQWREFFVLIGAVITVVGVAAWFLVRDRPSVPRARDGALGAVFHGLRPSAMRANPGLYLLLSAWAVWGVSTQVFLPYLIIYVQRYLQIEAYAVVLGVVLTGASAVTVGFG
ncbi:hypothetical protein ACFSTC_00330 [Nonomuraea ferruginea]